MGTKVDEICDLYRILSNSPESEADLLTLHRLRISLNRDGAFRHDSVDRAISDLKRRPMLQNSLGDSPRDRFLITSNQLGTNKPVCFFGLYPRCRKLRFGFNVVLLPELQGSD